jgi:hypothetical protein
MSLPLKRREFRELGHNDASDTWYAWHNGEWEEISLSGHNHSELGDINFTGSISTGGNAGLTGSRTVHDKKLTFTNGLLTGFEDA